MLLEPDVDDLSFRVGGIRPRYIPLTVLFELIEETAPKTVPERHLGRFYRQERILQERGSEGLHYISKTQSP